MSTCRPIIQASSTPGNSTTPAPGAVTTDMDVSTTIKPVVVKSSERSSRLEVSMDGSLATKRPKYCGAKIFQLFLQPSNQASR